MISDVKGMAESDLPLRKLSNEEIDRVSGGLFYYRDYDRNDCIATWGLIGTIVGGLLGGGGGAISGAFGGALYGNKVYPVR